MTQKIKAFEMDAHPFWNYFNAIGDHQSAATVYAGEGIWNALEGVTNELKKLNETLFRIERSMEPVPKFAVVGPENIVVGPPLDESSVQKVKEVVKAMKKKKETPDGWKT